MYIPSDNITDFILPLMKATYTSPKEQVIGFGKLFGTSFLIGRRGFALTAGHVIDQLKENYNPETEAIFTHIHNSNGVFLFKIISLEKHPQQDVGIIQLDENKFKSNLIIDPTRQNSSCEYHGWGYPMDTAEEITKLIEDRPAQPELIFTMGYIRRRISRELYPTMIYFGDAYYEVSELGGAGYSGAPIILKNSIGQNKWKVLGVYIGEKSEVPAVGYVIRSDSFYDWVPDILGCSIVEESLK
jgi:hypothetical protein